MTRATSFSVKDARPRTEGTSTAWICERLRRDILSLSIDPDEDLDEAGLVERFGMSQTPVREALIRLSSDGLVELLPNRGAKIAAIDLSEFPPYIEELDLIQRAATRRQAADLGAIEIARDQFEQAVGEGDPSTMTQSNRDFHVAGGETSGNRYISDVYARLLDQSMRMLRIPFAYDSRGDDGVDLHLAKIIREHRTLTKAIRNGGGERAERLAGDHTELFRSRLLQYLKQINTRPVRIPVPES